MDKVMFVFKDIDTYDIINCIYFEANENDINLYNFKKIYLPQEELIKLFRSFLKKYSDDLIKEKETELGIEITFYDIDYDELKDIIKASDKYQELMKKQSDSEFDDDDHVDEEVSKKKQNKNNFNKRIISLLTASVIMLNGFILIRKSNLSKEELNNNYQEEIVLDSDEDNSAITTEEKIIKQDEKITEENIYDIKNNIDDDLAKTANNLDTSKNEDIFGKKSFAEINQYAYLLYDTMIYEDYHDLEHPISLIDKFQRVYRLFSNGDFDYILTSDGIHGFILSDSLENLPEIFIDIDISDQALKMYENNEEILTTSIVSGKASTPTRIGYFEIYYKEMDAILEGEDYQTPVSYWMPFDGGIGLHDASWRSEFGNEIYYYSGSHGCINMPEDKAEYIYNNTEIGTKVLVHK